MAKKYDEYSNSLMKFIKEHCEIDSSGKIADWELKERFQAWLQDKGYRVWKVTEINNFLRERYTETRIGQPFWDKSLNEYKNSSVRGRSGIKWKEVTENT